MTKTLQVGDEYVVGFLFEEHSSRGVVVLINKLRPDWQLGKLNGVGGRIEGNETPTAAMRREFLEECGLDIDSWRLFCTLGDERGWRIHFFSATGCVKGIQSMTDEQVTLCETRRLPPNILPNLLWLIPMAISMEYDRADHFEIIEHAS